MRDHLSYEPGVVLPGTRFLVERRLGRGGMGTVYAVRNLDTGERLALKVISSSVARRDGGPAISARLVLEAEALCALSSPYLVQVHEVGRLRDGRSYYTMDLLEGETLSEALLRGPMPPAAACGFVLQALEALDAVHAAGIVHRDVKPANLFVRASDGVCVLIDFGLIKVLTDGARFTPLGFETVPGHPVGTARYLPPEVLDEGTPDARADVYGAGITLVELLTGGLPLAHLDDLAYMGEVRRHGFPVPDSVPAALRPVVRRATARNPAARYPSAAAFALGLAGACQRAGFGLAGARPDPRRRLRPAVLGAFASTAVFASAVVLVAPWRSAPAVVVRMTPEPIASPMAAAPAGLAAPEAPPLAPSAAAIAPEAAPPARPSAAPARSAFRPAGKTAAPAQPAGHQRAQLEAKLRGGRGTASEARTLYTLCLIAGDQECAHRALAHVARIESEQ
jgi:eukaryotic-like serine/threonine-protein kinase